MFSVHWKHIILDKDKFVGHRVARVVKDQSQIMPFVDDTDPGAADLPEDVSTWAPASNYKGEATAPATYPKDGLTYKFLFWSEPDSAAGTGGTFFDNKATVNVNEGTTLEATAWYAWYPGPGTGDNVVYLDAFDLTKNWFIPDNFVDVMPDPVPTLYDDQYGPLIGTLTHEANLGYLETGSLKGQEDITARKFITAASVTYRFQYWLLFSTGSQTDLTKQLDPDITVDSTTAMYAIAFYKEDKLPPPPVVTFLPESSDVPLGEMVDLTWTTQNADTASISTFVHSHPLKVSNSGSTGIYKAGPGIYTLTATGPGGKASATAVVSLRWSRSYPHFNLPQLLTDDWVPGGWVGGYPTYEINIRTGEIRPIPRPPDPITFDPTTALTRILSQVDLIQSRQRVSLAVAAIGAGGGVLGGAFLGARLGAINGILGAVGGGLMGAGLGYLVTRMFSSSQGT